MVTCRDDHERENEACSESVHVHSNSHHGIPRDSHGASRRRRRQKQLQTRLRPAAADAAADPAIPTSAPIYRLDVDKDRLIGRQVERQPRGALLLHLTTALRRLQRAQVRV